LGQGVGSSVERTPHQRVTKYKGVKTDTRVRLTLPENSGHPSLRTNPVRARPTSESFN